MAITYEITNQRETAIAVADIIPETTWDGETRTLTVSIGSEVPGELMLPRLIRIGPGEKKSFSTVARPGRIIPSASADPAARNTTLLRLKVNFLGGDMTPFAELLTMEAKGVRGLYIIGEVVDVTGWLGGYNFQWAWASGKAAGEHA